MILTPDASRDSPLRHFNHTTQLSEILSPRDAIRELNRRFQSKDDHYFTMIYGLFDTRSSILRMAQAGHPGPALFGKNCQPEILGTGGMPVGLWNEIDFDCFEVPVREGDRLLLYSDGVTECIDGKGEAFGEQRLLAYLAGASQPLDKLLEGLLEEIRNWRDGSESGDDVSLLAIERNADPAQ
jgi:sigma-B regulation protein RsbU (phosphoserine phosphatase)